MPASVLVVEDNPLIRRGMLVLLGRSGHSTTAVATIAEALSFLEKTTPTHLLLDLNLPDGPGTDILRSIRSRELPIRVALLTGASDTPLLEEAQSLTIEATFIKPPDWQKLLAWIAEPHDAHQHTLISPSVESAVPK